MPFLYELPAPTLHHSHMTPISAYRQNSNMISRMFSKKDRKQSNMNRTSQLLSTSPSTQPDANKGATTPTRRPTHLPSVSNQFFHSSSTTRPKHANQPPPPPSYTTIDTPTSSSSSPIPTSEHPPTYTPATPAAAPSTDNPHAFLATFDTVFMIDDSGSMSGSKWREAAAALSAITPICTTHDKDGIDIHFFNHPRSYCNITSPSRVDSIFRSVQPSGGTPTGSRLYSILKPYLAQLERRGKGKCDDVKPLNIIVLTDGEAHDDPQSVITNCAAKLDRLDASPWQVGIQFFQVGRDGEATRALRDLDDGLVELGCERDIVDTVPWTSEGGRVGLDADGILKVVLGAVNRRLDRKKVSLDMIRR